MFANEAFVGNKSMKKLKNVHWAMPMFLKENSHSSKTE